METLDNNDKNTNTLVLHQQTEMILDYNKLIENMVQTLAGILPLQGWVSSWKKGISSLLMGINGFLPGRKPFFREEIGKKLPRVTESVTIMN